MLRLSDKNTRRKVTLGKEKWVSLLPVCVWKIEGNGRKGGNNWKRGTWVQFHCILQIYTVHIQITQLSC